MPSMVLDTQGDSSRETDQAAGPQVAEISKDPGGRYIWW